MKFLLALSCLLVAASATDCTDCTAVVNTLAAFLTSEGSVARQVSILVGGICPGSSDPAECTEGLPEFWAAIAAVLWPGYYSPEADWMCASFCAAPQENVMDCEQCQNGIQATADQLVLPETISAIIEALTAEDGWCASVADQVEDCAEKVRVVIGDGLPMLVLGFNPADGPTICNTAVEGTCAARRARLF